MSQWGNTDDAANSVIWAAAQVNKTANTANRTALFGNTTADAFVTGVTTGQFGVSEGEAIAAREGAAVKTAHSGWVLRTVGSGGRAGRIQNEVLVAINTITGDAADDVVLPDFKVRVTTNPANTQNSPGGTNDVLAFTAAGATRPAGGTVSFLWYYSTDGGATFATTAAVPGFVNQTTGTLGVWANTIPDDTQVRAVLTASGGGNSANTTAAVVTIVP